jgi:hypothetical protein
MARSLLSRPRWTSGFPHVAQGGGRLDGEVSGAPEPPGGVRRVRHTPPLRGRAQPVGRRFPGPRGAGPGEDHHLYPDPVINGRTTQRVASSHARVSGAHARTRGKSRQAAPRWLLTAAWPGHGDSPPLAAQRRGGRPPQGPRGQRSDRIGVPRRIASHTTAPVPGMEGALTARLPGRAGLVQLVHH